MGAALTFGLAFVIAVPAPPVDLTGFKLVVNAQNPATRITRELASRLFLKKITRWEDGTPAAPVDLPESEQAREAFSRAIHGRRTGAIKAYWQQMVFSGRASPPLELARAAEVAEFVKTHRGAIAYLPASSPTEGLKVLEVAER